jgi:hypothetical protein
VEAQRGLSASAVCGPSRQPAGTGVQKHLLEPQTAGQFERDMNRSPQNVRQLVQTSQNQSAEPLATNAAKHNFIFVKCTDINSGSQSRVSQRFLLFSNIPRARANDWKPPFANTTSNKANGRIFGFSYLSRRYLSLAIWSARIGIDPCGTPISLIDAASYLPRKIFLRA